MDRGFDCNTAGSAWLPAELIRRRIHARGDNKNKPSLHLLVRKLPENQQK
jgi:hypothetical protein